MRATIYHNPRCSKSRATLAILEENKVEFETIQYLNNPPSAVELQQLLTDLVIDARSLMRQGEAEYKAQNLDNKTLSEADLIQAMINTPILIERPIVKTNKGTVIARPPENVLTII